MLVLKGPSEEQAYLSRLMKDTPPGLFCLLQNENSMQRDSVVEDAQTL